MYWATGFYSTDGVVIVDREATKLCVDSRYYEAACNAKESGALFDDVEVILLDKGVVDAVKTHAKGETYAVDSELVTVARLERLKKAFEGKTVVTQENICKDLRMIKSPDELEKIKTAQAITDAAFEHITRFIRKGLTEKRIAAELEFFVKSNGGDNMSFDTICVSGPNSSLPHGVPGDVEICENSFLTMDFGVKYKGYCSDMTRTVCIGKASDEQKYPMFSIIELSRSSNSTKYRIRLARVTNIMKKFKFTQTNYETKAIKIQWLKENSTDNFGTWQDTEDYLFSDQI
jgi:Xaa-Pro aminopeptidase